MEKEFDTQIIDKNIHDIIHEKQKNGKKKIKELEQHQKEIEAIYNSHYNK